MTLALGRSAVCAAVLFLWIVATAGDLVAPYILPSPFAVASAAESLVASRTLAQEGLVTARATVLGFALGAGAGLLLAYVACLSRSAIEFSHPFLVASQVIPKVAVFPILGQWFGFGMLSRVLIAATMVFFPVLINTLASIDSEDADTKASVFCMGATPTQTVRWLTLPSSAPLVFAALRLGSIQALVGVLIAEYLAPNAGLGYLLISYSDSFDAAGLFAVLAAIGALGALLYGALVPAERLFNRLYVRMVF